MKVTEKEKRTIDNISSDTISSKEAADVVSKIPLSSLDKKQIYRSKNIFVMVMFMEQMNLAPFLARWNLKRVQWSQPSWREPCLHVFLVPFI